MLVKINGCLMVKDVRVVALLSHTAGIIVHRPRIPYSGITGFLRHPGRRDIDIAINLITVAYTLMCCIVRVAESGTTRLLYRCISILIATKEIQYGRNNNEDFLITK